jgi:hypothetical protein
MASPMDIIADLTSSINEHTAKGSSPDVAVGASNVIDAAVEKYASSFFQLAQHSYFPRIKTYFSCDGHNSYDRYRLFQNTWLN